MDQFARRDGSAMRFFRPWAPNAPSMTLEAPKRVPIVQKGDIFNDYIKSRMDLIVEGTENLVEEDVYVIRAS